MLRPALEETVDLSHPQVRLARKIDWVSPTVQPKAIVHPTDARLCDRAMQKLVAFARRHQGAKVEISKSPFFYRDVVATLRRKKRVSETDWAGGVERQLPPGGGRRVVELPRCGAAA